MAESHQIDAVECSRFASILASVAIVVHLSITCFGGVLGTVEERRLSINPEDQVRTTALRSALRNTTVGFEPSLTMRENVDFLLTPPLLVQKVMADDDICAVCFDAIIQLNTPHWRTHVVLFARYWVSADRYQVVIVWAEPHAGSLNFPVYPPTLSIISTPRDFTVSHQLQHTYDGTFAKPLRPRGPLTHRFNTYALSDIRFAEQETLDLLRSVGYGHMDDLNGSTSRRQHLVVPERSITVGFEGEGPTIGIAGKQHHYHELETVQLEGGRQYFVDYRPMQIAEHTISLPSRITVFSGDGKQMLRSAWLCDAKTCPATVQQIENDAQGFGCFDANDVRCRELLLKYWMKPQGEIEPPDMNTLYATRSHFSETQKTNLPLGRQLKQVNSLLQVDWMLDDAAQLEADFRQYICLLSANDLGRMILFGGQNVIETTIRWAQFRAADKLLPLWLDAALSQNDPNSLLDFASANLATKRLWITMKLMEKVLASPAMPADRRFDAQACHALALSGLCQMASDPDHMIDRELDVAQVRWALIGSDEERLLAQLKSSLHAADLAYAAVVEPSREHRSLKKRLDAMEQAIGANRSQENETTDLQGN